MRTIAIALGMITLVAGAANALTLDNTIVRSIPFLQRLMITDQGDMSSSSNVELSGTNMQLIRLYPTTLTSMVLQAPLGLFEKHVQVGGDAFAPGSIGTIHIINNTLLGNDFSSTTLTYLTTILGGGVNDGSCPTGEVAIGFLNGDIICASATFANTLPDPLCPVDTIFIGWLGYGVPNCGDGTSITNNGDEFWKQSDNNPYDIYYGWTGTNTCVEDPQDIATGWFYGIGTGNGQIDQSVGWQTVVPNCSCDLSNSNADCNIYENTYGYPGTDPYFTIGDDVGSSCVDFFVVNGERYKRTFKKRNYIMTEPSANPNIVCEGEGSGFVGVGRDNPLVTLHVSSPSTADGIEEPDPDQGGSNVLYSAYGNIQSYHQQFSQQYGGPRCPCDISSNNHDCSGGGTFYLPYPQYNYAFGNQTCTDIAISNNSNEVYHHPMFVSFANNIFTFQVSAVSTTPVTLPPRCSCDTTDTSNGECAFGQMAVDFPTTPWNPSDGVRFTGANQGPQCFDLSIGGGSPGYPQGPFELWYYDKILDVTDTTPGPGTPDPGDPSAQGTIPTFRSDGVGILEALVTDAYKAGQVGALSIPYNGAVLYMIGSRVGINTNIPQAAFDVHGKVRFPSLVRPGYSHLTIDTLGNVFLSGSTNGAPDQIWQQILTDVFYNGGKVGIGTSNPAVKLHVDGDIMTNQFYIASDEQLKTNIVEIDKNDALNNILQVNGYTFNWISNGKADVGLLAHEVDKISPDITTTVRVPGIPPRGRDTEYLAVEYVNIIAAAIQAVEAVHDKLLDAGQERLNQQIQQISILRQRIEALETGTRWDGVDDREGLGGGAAAPGGGDGGGPRGGR